MIDPMKKGTNDPFNGMMAGMKPAMNPGKPVMQAEQNGKGPLIEAVATKLEALVAEIRAIAGRPEDISEQGE